MTKIRVLIVDDSAFLRRAIRSVLRTAEDIEVVGAARNGREAIDQARALSPDIVTLDVTMPEMDGLAALPEVKRVCKAKVIMVSSHTTEGTHETLEALRRGADDFIAKDTGPHLPGLVEKIRALAGARRLRVSPTMSPNAPRRTVRLNPDQFDVIVVGSSTGGPAVLETIFTALPSPFPLPIVIAQHMPPLFTKSMAERLDRSCQIPAHHVDQPLLLERGHLYLAEGGKHIKVRRRAGGQFGVEMGETPKEAPYRPSVDELFATTADALGGRALGIVLTGMGQDGLVGGRVLRGAGAKMIAQSAETCVVYGMPKAVVEAGLVDATLSPEEIAQTLSLLASPGSAVEPRTSTGRDAA
jgi:two-component system chemotaxis response regulator CheB